MGIEITVNEKVESTDAASDTPLLYVLRDDLELRGPKFGCGLVAVRRLLGARGRQGDPLLRDAGRGCRGQEDHHPRRAAGLACAAEAARQRRRRCIRCSRPGSTSKFRSAATARAE